MKTVLINLVASNSGGGLQNSLSLVQQLNECKDFASCSIVACLKNSLIHKACLLGSIDVHPISASLPGRLHFELFGCYFLVRRRKLKLIFTLFGNCPLFCPGAYKISGFAYSNILMPEIPFWDFLPAHKRIFKIIKDFFRLWAAQKCDEIIFETEFLSHRAKTGPFSSKTVHVVPMEPSELIRQSGPICENQSAETAYHDFIFISGPHPNKRIHLFAAILKHFNTLRTANAMPRARVILTMDQLSEYSKTLTKAFASIGLSEYVDFIGAVSPYDIRSLLNRPLVVVNIARLESFSNNWVEAWATKSPLVSTDAEWTRESCADAAIYIDPLDAVAAADIIFRALNSEAHLKNVIRAGQKRLLLLGQEKKIYRYYAIIQQALRRLDSPSQISAGCNG